MLKNEVIAKRSKCEEYLATAETSINVYSIATPFITAVLPEILKNNNFKKCSSLARLHILFSSSCRASICPLKKDEYKQTAYSGFDLQISLFVYVRFDHNLSMISSYPTINSKKCCGQLVIYLKHILQMSRAGGSL